MAKTKAEQAECQEAIEFLRKIVPVGTTVYNVLRHVSSSGMTRHIDCYVMRPNETTGESTTYPMWITHWVAKVIDCRMAKNERGMVVGGCGMDMGFHVVYNLGRVLFPEGFDIPAGKWGRNGTKVSEHDTDGGYALTASWM